MTVRNFNNVTTLGTLSGPAASSATTFTVDNFTNSPTPPFTITVDRNTPTEEICLVTSVNGTVLTVTRGYDSTAAQTHLASATVEHTAIAKDFVEANAHVNATAGVHGTTGDLVGTEGPQDIADKSFISPLCEADVTAGDGIVLWIPPGAEVRNLARGMNSNGDDVFTVDANGKVIAHGAQVIGATALNGNVTISGTAAVSGAATLSGAATVTGLVTANGGVTVPTGKKVTVTDAPVAGTDAANKAYVDGQDSTARTYVDGRFTGVNWTKLVSEPNSYTYTAGAAHAPLTDFGGLSVLVPAGRTLDVEFKSPGAIIGGNGSNGVMRLQLNGTTEDENYWSTAAGAPSVTSPARLTGSVVGAGTNVTIAVTARALTGTFGVSSGSDVGPSLRYRIW